MIDEIKSSSKLSDVLKEVCVDFFEHMIHITYRKDNIFIFEEDESKKKVKIILRRLENY